jgi:hypothetical protein
MLSPGNQIVEGVNIRRNADGDPDDRAPKNDLVAHLILLFLESVRKCGLSAELDFAQREG